MERFHIFLVLHNSCKFSIFCYNIFLEPSLSQVGTRKDLPYTLTYLIIEEFRLLLCISDFALPPLKNPLFNINYKNSPTLQNLFTLARLFHPPRLLILQLCNLSSFIPSSMLIRYTVLHMFRQVQFGAGNQGNHQNFEKSLLTNKL